eukprot:gene740-918_t
MRIIISGGGTGGHIYPGIAIADACKRRDPVNEILFIGAAGRMEMQHVPAAGYPIVGLPIKGMVRKIRQCFSNLTLPFWILVSLYKVRRIMKRFNPHVVVGTGGYASFPAVYMAAKLHIPVILQEQNAYPGIANRFLARYVQKVCVSYEHMEAYFPAHKLVITGNPIRLAINKKTENREDGLTYFGLLPGKFTLLVLGGSLGAQAISQAILEAVATLSQYAIQIILSTGKAHFPLIDKKVAHIDGTPIKIFPYIDRMDLALSVADLVVSRAGAISIAEIAAAHKPAIFIPSPHVVANHQVKNTLPLLAKDAAVVLSEEEVPHKLIPTLLQLAQDESRRMRLADNLSNCFPKDAAGNIVSIMEKLAHKEGKYADEAL